MYRIATNQCLDMLRKSKKRSKDISLFQTDAEGEEEWIIEQATVQMGVSEQVEKKELQEIVHLGLGELKEDYQFRSSW